MSDVGVAGRKRGIDRASFGVLDQERLDEVRGMHLRTELFL